MSGSLLAVLADGKKRVSVVRIQWESGDAPAVVIFCGDRFRRTDEKTRGGYRVYQRTERDPG